MFNLISIIFFILLVAALKIKNYINSNNPSDDAELKVCILGKLETKFFAPFDDERFKIWTLNYHNENLPSVDLWFDIHSNNPNPKANITRKNYPFKKAEELLGGNYFNNTVSYMIAYAILLGYKKIYLFGMTFQDDSKNRFCEFQNVRELIFFAKGMGVDVVAPVDEIMTRDYKRYGI